MLSALTMPRSITHTRFTLPKRCPMLLTISLIGTAWYNWRGQLADGTRVHSRSQLLSSARVLVDIALRVGLVRTLGASGSRAYELLSSKSVTNFTSGAALGGRAGASGDLQESHRRLRQSRPGGAR